MLSEVQQKNVLVLSGPSGSGKGTIVNLMRQKFANVERAVSATTRPPRQGERDGVDYHYLSKAQFEENIAAGKLLEYTCYVGNYYGTLHTELARIVDAGKICVLEIEVEGAAHVKKCYPFCKTIFVMPPNKAELESRLRKRETEDEETIKKRMATAQQEILQAQNYDFVVTNHVVEDCAKQIYAIVAEAF